MTAIRFVPGGPDDRQTVAGYIGQLYGAHDVHPDGKALLDRADQMLAAGPVYLMRRDDAVIGYAALKEMGDHMFVRHFVIDKDLRGGGVGTRAFKALETECFPGRQVRLDASHVVDGPRAFWEAQGFQIMGYAMRRNAPEEIRP